MPAAASSRPGLRAHPRFVTVVAGEGLSMLGDSAFDIALAWMVLHETGSVAALAGVMLAQAVPRGLLLLLGGAITDRMSARRVMLAAHVVRAVTMAVLAALVISGSVQMWHLYVVAVVAGITAAMFTPASESVLPHLLPEAAYARGNAAQGFLEQVSYLLGPVIGAGLIVLGGAGAAIAANALTFAVAACTVRSVPRGAHVEGEAGAGILADIRVGLAHAWRSHETRLVLLIVAAATLSYSGLFAVGLPTLAASWTSSPWALSVLVSAWGAGQLIGTAAAAVTGLPDRWGLLIIGMTLAEGSAFALLGHTPSAWVAAAILVPLGIGVAYSSDVALPTFIQTRTPKHLLGRISALLGLPRVVLEPLSIAVLGAALHRSIAWGFALAAVPVLVLGLYLLADPVARGLRADADA
ncbi:MFS transporter [Arsenicicoccus sp. UBA7492]|uniref:MFS transporter n=1 Tax=Arsenicicoccus sp. UBA7492 TaxID=1946057 RepID=UPI00257C52FF|nr:MFS transporter [Arsenicicoccus sp. UBA7492]